MPVHSRGDKKETNHHDEMEVDYAENEGSSSEDEDTESSSVSEDGDSSGARPGWAGTPGPSARRATGRGAHAGRRVLLRARGGETGKGRGLARPPAPGSCGAPPARAPSVRLGGPGADLWGPEGALSTGGALSHGRLAVPWGYPPGSGMPRRLVCKTVEKSRVRHPCQRVCVSGAPRMDLPWSLAGLELVNICL